MKTFNSGQLIFLLIVTIPLAWVIATVVVYPMNGLGLKATWKTYQFGMLWQVLFADNIRSDIRFSGIKAIGAGFCGAVMILVMMFLAAKQSKTSIYGDAKFASDADIRKSRQVTWGDKSKGGIIIGSYKGRLLRYTQPDFISMGAGTRAGKGAGIVIPNLLDYEGSMMVLDPKQECYTITSKYRQKILGSEVYLFDPFSRKTHGFNALAYVDLSTEQGVTDLLSLGETIYTTDGKSGAEKHFNGESQLMFVGCAELLWFLMTYRAADLRSFGIKHCFSIGTILELFNRIPMEDVLANREVYLETTDDPHVLFIIKDALDKFRHYVELGDEPKSSVSGTFTEKLKLFTLPLFRTATDRNDFDIRDMRRKKMSVYLGIMATEVDIANNLLNLFFNFAIKVSMRENPDFVRDLKYDVLFLLDEFPAIGYMPYIKKAAGFIAGYKLKLLTIYQNISQLNEIYGIQGALSLLANHPCKIIYATSEKEDADKFSAQLGYTTIKTKGKSRNTSKGGTSRGESESDTQRALVLPQELSTLKFDEEFILLKGENPIKCKKAFYFNDHYFMDKLVSVSPKLEAAVKELNKGVAMGKPGLRYPPKEIMLSYGELEADLDLAA
ncbi:type IV secretory system conjugative DNA transfer family protein [Escherichia coli]|uniref:type IV secretory system conjugative DNA transfer family protein n=1 Tax=Escherichia coli TaxID=562 RepID=UPI0007A05BBC|nr:type IV secretory system conjugative DNA transfer family protein [Escherichia coli]ELY7793277.1 type IV secretory system conjugative DNA transfer family protein [Shigella sonnei]AUL82670.1 conjugal transfer protein TraG [Escherichia coli]AUL87942.1 conjugal transfer protein TraG [Escherichia coli]AUM25360.1 conjugal transfer protein TraG [Escherichia coli]EEC7627898.1 type IV secretory system conjugative DNA transfer family protein [Escherichia coli]